MNDKVRLSGRERQIMDIVYAKGSASVNEVVDDMVDAPGRTAVRTMMRILEGKGHLRHRKEGRAFIYSPTYSKKRAGKQQFRRVLDTFFDGSLANAVESYLSDAKAKPSADDLKRAAQLASRGKGR